jgi:hypothetical protein
MKISFVRRGGWAAPINMRSPPAVLDADSLTSADREELNRLVQAAFARRERELRTDRRAAGSYTITVEDGDGQRTLSGADAMEESEPAIMALREWLENRLHAYK